MRPLPPRPLDQGEGVAAGVDNQLTPPWRLSRSNARIRLTIDALSPRAVSTGQKKATVQGVAEVVQGWHDLVVSERHLGEYQRRLLPAAVDCPGGVGAGERLDLEPLVTANVAQFIDVPLGVVEWVVGEDAGPLCLTLTMRPNFMVTSPANDSGAVHGLAQAAARASTTVDRQRTAWSATGVTPRFVRPGGDRRRVRRRAPAQW